MIRVLVTGKLHGAPEVRTGKTGKPFTTAKLVADAGEERDVWCSVIAFGAPGERLAGLKHADAAAVAGRATLQAYQAKDGELRASLSVVADEFAATRRAPKQAEAQSSRQREGQTDFLDEEVSF